MILFKDFTIIDLSESKPKVADVLVDDNGTIVQINEHIQIENAKTIWGSKRVLTLGFCDIHCNFGEPGLEYRETVKTGSEAALAGGFTSVALFPNTRPVIDSLQAFEYLRSKTEHSPIEIEILAALSKDCGGELMSPVKSLMDFGVKGFTDGEKPVQNSLFMKHVMEYISMYGRLILSHPEDKILSGNGVLNESYEAQRLGLSGIPKATEEIFIHRDCSLLKNTGGKLHFTNVTTKQGIEALEFHKSKGLDITASVAPFYFTLTDSDLDWYNTSFKLSPPLRSPEDVEAVRSALKSGILDFIVSSHTPHSEIEKTTDFTSAPIGAISLETVFSVSYMNLVKTGIISLNQLLEKLVSAPRKRLEIPVPEIRIGSQANFTVIDLYESRAVTKESIKSKSKNTPFLNKKLDTSIDMVFVKNKLHTFHETASSDYSNNS